MITTQQIPASVGASGRKIVKNPLCDAKCGKNRWFWGKTSPEPTSRRPLQKTYVQSNRLQISIRCLIRGVSPRISYDQDGYSLATGFEASTSCDNSAAMPAWEVPRLNIRPARVGDVPAIYELIRTFADRKLMIRRSLGELYESIREFLVAVDAENRVIGCVALHVFWEDLAELKCLAVAEDAQGQGVGRQLVDACWEAARELEIDSVFALTYAVEFFERSGYHQIDKAELPHKIWNECVRCPLFPNCQEVALIRSHEPERVDRGFTAQARASRGIALSRAVRSAREHRCSVHDPPTRPPGDFERACGASTLAIMLATEPRLAIVWDEGYTLGREARLRAGFVPCAIRSGFAAGGPLPRSNWCSRSGHAASSRSDRHPNQAALRPRGPCLFLAVRPGRTARPPAVLCAARPARRLLTPAWKDLPRARLGPILLFSCTAGFLFTSSPGDGGLGRRRGCRGLGVSAQPLRPRPLRDLRRRSDITLGAGDPRFRPGHRVPSRDIETRSAALRPWRSGWLSAAAWRPS